VFVDGVALHHLQGAENMIHQHNVEPPNVWYENVRQTPPNVLE
jgi:hypothetical protein